MTHDGKPSFAPVCITGMHRTGTSLVAGLLHRHGLWLGEAVDMMRPNPYNPAGYFENERLVEVDDAILGVFGGSWSSPPEFPEDWTEDPRLDDLRVTARGLGESLATNHAIWGFKDPRAALTLPFWRSVWGNVTVVVTLRSPLETARSLNRRDHLSLDEGTALWAGHYRSILDHTTPATRTVVGYESFCTDPFASATALLSRLPGLDRADAAAIRESVRPTLRHFRAGQAELGAAGLPQEVCDLYDQLKSECVNAEAYAESAAGDDVSELDLAIRDVHAELERLAAVVARLENEIGFIRRDDLAGITAHLEHQRGLVERIAQALPPLGERVSATEAAIQLAVNGSR